MRRNDCQVYKTIHRHQQQNIFLSCFLWRWSLSPTFPVYQSKGLPVCQYVLVFRFSSAIEQAISSPNPYVLVFLPRVELERPRVLDQELIDRLFQLIVGHHPDWILGIFPILKLDHRDRAPEEVLVVVLSKLISPILPRLLGSLLLDLKVAQDDIFLISLPRLKDHWVMHQLSRDHAQVVVRNKESFSVWHRFVLDNLQKVCLDHLEVQLTFNVFGSDFSLTSYPEFS